MICDRREKGDTSRGDVYERRYPWDEMIRGTREEARSVERREMRGTRYAVREEKR